MDWGESDYSRDTVARLERSGALVGIACAPDACEICRAKATRIYTPSHTPRLPIPGCKNQRCRCRFVAIDPQSKLSVPELVRRGAQAFKAGKNRQAHQILQRAVTLDSRSEQGWFWLSGVVDDQSKIACLEKVLSINPKNERAQAGLAALREKRRTISAIPAPVRQTAPQAPPASPVLPVEVVEAREEREIIAEQWGEFLGIAAATDSQMLLMQGNAFLAKMQRLNAQALQSVLPEQRLEELQLQWHESEIVGEALADLLHDPDLQAQPTWGDMHQSLRMLAQQLLDHRSTLRTQIQQTGGQIPQ